MSDILKTLRGEVEVIGEKNGKVFHYEKSANTVTDWAKHSTMHVLTGEAFTTHGVQRSFDTSTDHPSQVSPGEGHNSDGTLISGQQYFQGNEDYQQYGYFKSRSTQVPNTGLGDSSNQPEDMYKPFFPTKMLFGTGFEWKNWTELEANNPEHKNAYFEDGWNQSTFDSNINEVYNNYSGYWDSASSVLNQTRTMNDIYSGPLSEIIESSDFGIKGAVKNGLYFDSDSDSANIIEEGGNKFLDKQYAGIGLPCFIYPNRESRFFQDGAEIFLSADGNFENKITFTVVMPEQSGTNAGIFYPYNGYILKQAGLFCDANLVKDNTSSGDDLEEKMPHGLLFAKKNISPITKSHDVAITIRWTIYL